MGRHEGSRGFPPPGFLTVVLGLIRHVDRGTTAVKKVARDTFSWLFIHSFNSPLPQCLPHLPSLFSVPPPSHFPHFLLSFLSPFLSPYLPPSFLALFFLRTPFSVPFSILVPALVQRTSCGGLSECSIQCRGGGGGEEVSTCVR